MKSIIAILEEAWSEAREEFLATLHETAGQLKELIRLEDYHRHGHDTEHLKEALGPFGATSMDLKALSAALGEGGRTRLMTPERKERVESLIGYLERAISQYAAQPPRLEDIGIEENEQAIHDAAETHLNRLADLFKHLRIAQLEIKAKYQPQRHDTIFLDFNWRHLSPAETRLCPPFIVTAELKGDDQFTIRKMMSLLTSRKPIKILAVRRNLRKSYPAASSPDLPATMDIEMFPLAMRGIYALQTSPADPRFRDLIATALHTSRPGVISVFWPPDARSDDDRRIRCERALYSRTFPAFIYDPDCGREFVSNIDLSGNPDPAMEWVRQTLVYKNADGKACELERNFTFANFASAEKEFESEFADLPPGTDAELAIPLSEFLTLTRPQRIGRIPYVTVLDDHQHLVKRVPSQDVITQTSDRMHLWRTLREFAGFDNPHVKMAESAVRTQKETEYESMIQELRRELKEEAEQQARLSIAGAVRMLAARLSGVDPSCIDMSALTQTSIIPAGEPPAAERQEPEEAGQAGALSPGTAQDRMPDLPWIDSSQCTACDECITMNSRIFGYNEDKQAVIKDPYGGPYKDLVRAAEKCPAEIIHPGLPLDPGEKGLEKLIKRAERYR